MQIGLHFIRKDCIVDTDVGTIRCQYIPQNSTRFVQFAQNTLSRLGILQSLVQFSPTIYQILQICMQVSSSFFFSDRTHNDSEARRPNTLHQSLQTGTLLLALNSS